MRERQGIAPNGHTLPCSRHNDHRSSNVLILYGCFYNQLNSTSTPHAVHLNLSFYKTNVKIMMRRFEEHRSTIVEIKSVKPPNTIQLCFLSISRTFILVFE